MKILLIHQYFLEAEDAGGSRWNEMVRFWAEQGHKITVIAGMVHYSIGKKNSKYKGKFTFTDFGFFNNVDVIRTHVSESYNNSFIGRLWAYFSFVFSGIWGGLFKAKSKYDIIIVSSPPLFVGIIAYVLSKLKRIPYIFEVRDLWPESAIDTGILTNKLIINFSYWFESLIYRNAKLINVLTPAFRERLIDEKNIPQEKVILIPNAADFTFSEKLLDNFNAEKFRKERNLSTKFVITYVGAHGVANHLIQIIETAEKLQDTNVFFQLVGAGMEKEFLISEARKRNLKNVKFIDSVPKEEVFKYILGSDMGTSVLKKNDTFKTIYSNKTFDYMSCKKPVFMLIDGISKDLVLEARCGVYAEPENINEIEKRIRELLLKPKEQLEAMGINGYNYAKKNFDRTKLSLKFLKEINNVLTEYVQ